MKAISMPLEKGDLVLCESASEVGRKAAAFFADSAQATKPRLRSWTEAAFSISTILGVHRRGQS
jgi:hypothetical protein